MTPAPAPMWPARYVVTGRHAETDDTVTLMLRPAGNPIEPPRPGQFTMLYAFGVGEVPVSISGFHRGEVLVQTIRAVGAVTRALCAAAPGDMIGVRGPFGTDWRLSIADGRDAADRGGRHRPGAAAPGGADRAGPAGQVRPGGAAGRRAVAGGPDLHPGAGDVEQARRRRPGDGRPRPRRLGRSCRPGDRPDRERDRRSRGHGGVRVRPGDHDAAVRRHAGALRCPGHRHPGLAGAEHAVRGGACAVTASSARCCCAATARSSSYAEAAPLVTIKEL